MRYGLCLRPISLPPRCGPSWRKRVTWTGTATELLADLGDDAGESLTRAKEWPKTPNTLGGRLRRASPLLRKVGIRISFARDAGDRTVTVTTEAEQGGKSSSSSSSSSSTQGSQALNDDNPCDDVVTPDPLKSNENDDDDNNETPLYSRWTGPA